MNEKNKKRSTRGSISEEDISTLFQRYSATTVLALLQEVAQSPGLKIDWNSLVKKTATGISNAREYQMLWRHLAYRHALDEKPEDAAEPMEDDSDLEYELNASPPVSAEASTEAAACVKVLIASRLPSELSLANGSTVEAPLTINIPNCQSSKAGLENALSASIQGTNIIVPVSIQKQPPAGIIAVGEMHGPVNSSQASRKKRKPWSEEEDLELIAAVKKCGEGNWANILKGDFKGDRTASQLSQRWSTIRRKQGSLSIGAITNIPQLSEAQLATRRAIDMALKDNNLTPVSGNANSNCIAGNGAATTSNPATVNASSEDLPGVKKDSSSQQQSHHQVVVPASTKAAVLGPLLKPRPPTKKMPAQSTVSPDSMVKAAAVAAGARIASQAEATIIKAAQSKKTVHFPAIKPSVVASGNLLPSTSLPGHPNVHFLRATSVPATLSHLAAGNHQVQANVPKPSPSVALPQSVKSASVVTTPAATPSPLAAGNHQVQGNIPKPAAPLVATPLSVKPAPAIAMTVATPSPVAAGNHQVQGNGAKPVAPSVAFPQSVKPAPALTTTVNSSLLCQPVKAAAAIARPGIQSTQTLAAATCVPFTAKVSGLVGVPVSNATATVSSLALPHAVKASGNVNTTTISSVQALSAACSPPIDLQGKQALKTAGPLHFSGSSTKQNTVVQQDLPPLLKSNTVQLAPKSANRDTVKDKPTADHCSTKGIEVASKVNRHEVCCTTVQDKSVSIKDGNAVGGLCERSLNGKQENLSSSTVNTSVKNAASG